MPRTTPALPTECDGAFLFKNDEFPVLTTLVLALSPTTRQFTGQTRFVRRITSNVSPDSVAEFAKLFQSNHCQITPSNALDLLLLCQELGVSPGVAKVTEFLGSNSIDLLISSLSQNLNDSDATAQLEVVLSKQLIDNIDNKRLMQLPFPCLQRVIRSVPLDNSDTKRKLFKFCLSVFDHFGPKASGLFNIFELKDLSPQETEDLTNRPDFMWPFLGGSVHATLHSWNASTLEFLR
jgi:hypothetical protein